MAGRVSCYPYLGSSGLEKQSVGFIVRHVIILNRRASLKDWRLVLHEINLSYGIFHSYALSSQIRDFSHKDLSVYSRCKKNIDFGLSPPISDASANAKRVNYKQLHFSWVNGKILIQEGQAWTVHRFLKQCFEEKIWNKSNLFLVKVQRKTRFHYNCLSD